MRSIWLLLVLTPLGSAADYPSARELQEASADKQRASARVQESVVAARNPSAPTLQLVDSPLCDPPPTGEIRQIIDDGARRTGLSPALVRAVVRKESGYNPCATSGKGAQGLMQLMPSVQAQFGVTNPYDPRQNVDAGVRLLKQLLGQYGGDLARALSAYNAGPSQVDRFGGVPPFPETVDYVSGIMGDLSPK